MERERDGDGPAGRRLRPPRLMEVSRRAFFKGMGGCAMGGALVLASVRAPRAEAAAFTPTSLIPAGASPDRLTEAATMEPLHAETFLPYIDQIFSFETSTGQWVDAQLYRVQEHNIPQPAAVQMEVFSLFFCGPQAAPLSQGTYSVRHAEMGTFHLFIVPVGLSIEGRLYEAAFSRITRQG